MEKWILHNKKADFEEMTRQLGIDALTARLLANRQVRDVAVARFYLRGRLEDLPAPELLKDGEKAAALLKEELSRSGRVAVASDYDADGLFAGQILKESLENLGFQVKVLTPNRIQEGYGLNRRILEEAAAFGAGLVLTCDNGIAARDEAEEARSMGLRLIITDHHEVPEAGLPEADAVVDPKRKDCTYPFEGICGALVALKVMQLLYRLTERDERVLFKKMLPYAAIATVADLMDLREENRIIVREGLKALAETDNTGLRALIEALGLSGRNLTPYHIGFVIGPCFNAAGRLETIEMAQELLAERETDKAALKAAELIALNQKRQQLTQEGVVLAEEILSKAELDPVIVLHLPGVHESLAGIIAGRIKEKYYRPALVLTGEGESLKGSARSVPAYPLYEKMAECADLFTRFGGHAMAAGFSLPAENLPELRKRLNEKSGLTEETLSPIIYLDAAMPPEYATVERVKEWESIGPFGKGFERPLFGRSPLKLRSIRVLGQKRNALRLRFSGESGEAFEGIWFGDVSIWEAFIRTHYGEKTFTMLERGQTQIPIALAYQPMLHEYNGIQSIQFQIKHFQAVT